jgi:hypothetical protein
MPNKSASEITYQFLHGILARFGASAEVITDGGGEFEAAFDKLLVQALIDHRVTSASHPQANGLSERTVKTLKTCISRYVDSTGNPEEWDMFLPWIVMGYRVTPQESTKVCPFTMLYGVSPVVPPNVRDRLGIPLDLDANLDEVAAESLLIRAKIVESACKTAGHNLAKAQVKDQLRYALLRSGGYQPALANFKVGDYVYVKHHHPKNALYPQSRQEVLRVHQVKPSGVLVLIGRNGTTVTENMINISPCKLLIENEKFTPPSQNRPKKEHCCEGCGHPHHEHKMLICDSCNRGWHTYCLTPVLRALPPAEEPWLCPQCLASGVNPDTGCTAKAQRRLIRAGKKALKQQEAAGKVASPAKPRKARQVGRATALAGTMESLPVVMDWVHSQNVLRHMGMLMPGAWEREMIPWLSNPAPEAQLVVQGCRVSPAGLMPLLGMVVYSTSIGIVDMCSEYGSIQTAFEEAGWKVETNCLTDESSARHHWDAMQPMSYIRMRGHNGMHTIVVAPRKVLLDVVLPLSIRYARHLVCCYAPRTYLTTAHGIRAAFLKALHEQGRVHLLPGSVRGDTQESYVWILVFATKAMKSLML